MSTAACAAYTGSEVNLTVARAGTVVITASVELYIYHAATMSDALATVHVGRSTTDCGGLGAEALVPVGQPAAYYYVSVSVVEKYAISSAGTYPFFVTGEDSSTGADTVGFFWATVVGVFYPS